jgi:hypothetical protein
MNQMDTTEIEDIKNRQAELRQELEKMKKQRIKEMEFWEDSKKKSLFYVV